MVTMLDLSNLPNYTEAELIDWLKHADDLYENDVDAVDAVDDSVYDSVRRFCEVYFPANQYFIGTGSDVRGSKIKLAYPMNGLVQRYENDMQQWIDSVNGLKVTSEKLDGVSGQLIFNKGQLQISFSRGNGLEAADTTRHVRNIPSVPVTLLNQDTMVDGACVSDITLPVRVELIISKENWKKVQGLYTKRDNSKYANARAMVAGIMNSSSVPADVYQYIDCVAYTIIDCKESKVNQFKILSALGFKIPKYEEHPGRQTTDFYTQLTSFWRHESDYDLDGVVVNAGDDSAITNCVNTGVPAAIKFKVMEANNVAVATVKEVVYTVSKDGYAKPRVNVYPVALAGVTVSYATGFNAQYIQKNGIGPGAKVRITRSGDVVPYILGVEYSVTPQLPDADEIGDWAWNATGVDAVLVDRDSNPDALLNRLTNTCTKLKITHAKEGNIRILIENGYDTIEKILMMDYIELYQCLGEIGKKIYESKTERLTDIYWPDFVGALNILGRGIGIRKVTAAYNHFCGDIDCMRDLDRLLSVPGFELATSKPIVDNIDEAISIIQRLTDEGRLTIATYEVPTAPTGSKFQGKGVLFTGIRDAQLETQIIAEGGEIKSGISSAVHILVCKDVNTSSGKAKKAREMGIEIIDVLELRRRLL